MTTTLTRTLTLATATFALSGMAIPAAHANMPEPPRAVATTTTKAPAAEPVAKISNVTNAKSGTIIANAKKYSGISYSWGGTTTKGFDCSGYTQFVYKKSGKTLPRTAEAQRRATKRVSKPQVGDLVFFGSPAYHVGIYAGNGKMYDAPRPGKKTGLHPIWTYKNVSYGHK